MPCGVCQEVFSIFSKSFWKPFGVLLLTSVNSIPPQAPEVKNFLLKSCTISGDPKYDFLCSLPIDFLLAVVYNENSARCVRQRAVEEGIVHFDEKRGALPLLVQPTFDKIEQVFIFIWKFISTTLMPSQIFPAQPLHQLHCSFLSVESQKR